MTCLHYRNSRSEHRGMAWINCITDTSRNKHRVTIHKIYRRIHSKVTNTSTLLLTRKVFSRHYLLAQFFFFVSSGSSLSPYHLHLQFISIFKSSSSSSHLDLNHYHWIWIITRFGSSLVLEHLYWIIITGAIYWFFSSQEIL